VSRERNYNIELLRVISCILVVCIHVSNVYSRAYGEVSYGTYLFSLFTNCFSRVAVPVFFMISGYLLLEENVSIHKSIHRVIHTLVVLVFWSVLYYIWNIIFWDDRYDFATLFEEPVKKHLWFLYAILGMYIALPFFQLLFKKNEPSPDGIFCHALDLFSDIILCTGTGGYGVYIYRSNGRQFQLSWLFCDGIYYTIFFKGLSSGK